MYKFRVNYPGVFCAALMLGLAGCGGSSSGSDPAPGSGTDNNTGTDTPTEVATAVAPLVGEWQLQLVDIDDEILYLEVTEAGVLRESLFDVTDQCIEATVNLPISFDVNDVLFAMSPLDEFGEPLSELVNPDLRSGQGGLLEVADNNPDSQTVYLTSSVDPAESISTLSSCSDSTPLSSSQTLRYTDTFLQIDYPSDWTVITSNPTVSAILVSPQETSSGGNTNCTVNSVFFANSSIAAVANELSTSIFNAEPTPQISFLEVNGTSMSRISGRLRTIYYCRSRMRIKLYIRCCVWVCRRKQQYRYWIQW